MAVQLVLTNGELIRKARVEARLNQTELGKLVGVRQETISSWENNYTEPSMIQAKRIEDATGALWLWSELRRKVQPSDMSVDLLATAV